MNILIVDDTENNLKTMEVIFNDNFTIDFNLIYAFNGEEALKIVLTENIDLIITDYSMPKMDGLEFVKIIKKNNNLKKIPILVLTCFLSHTSDIENEFIELGIFEFMSKPINLPRFLNKIKVLLFFIDEKKKINY